MPLLDLTSVESLISIICLFFAYCLSVTITGAGQAAVAKAMGDDTAAEEGFLSFNPTHHIDPLGTLMIVLFRFGWGRQIPIDPSQIKHSWYAFRVFCAYYAEAFFSFAIAIVALFVLVLFFNITALPLAVEMFFSGFAPTRSFIEAFPQTSSITVVSALLLVSLVFFNVFITTYSIAINTFKFIIARGVHKGYSYVEYADMIMIFAPLLFLLFFAPALSHLVMHGILIAAYALAHILGVL